MHILSGLTAVISGALAATAKKRPGRHPRAGRIYLWALGGVFVTATIMAIIRWREDAHLLAIAVMAFSLGLYGYQARRRRRPGWPPHHAIGMGGSYIALLTGVPLIWLALHRFRRVPARARPDGDPTAHRLDATPTTERFAPDISDQAGIPHT